jgi:hypothetical protein
VKKALSQSFEEPKIPGRHATLSNAGEIEILDEIAKNIQKNSAVMKIDILRYGVDRFGKGKTKNHRRNAGFSISCKFPF